MNPINVLVNDQIAGEMLPRIEAVDKRIRVTHIGNTLTAEIDGDLSASHLLDELLSDTEVYAGMRIPARLLTRAPGSSGYRRHRPEWTGGCSMTSFATARYY